ncbi:MAG: UPF0280 family protein, partial [Elusimicrobiota bacterium]|nr:UPF0280 family protein [Elusimicrobiota bacterium]
MRRMYQPRFYRLLTENTGLVSFNVCINETDLQVYAKKNLKVKAYKLLLKYRTQIERYIKHNKEFLTTLSPYEIDNSAPEIVQEMIKSTRKVSVGPMAAVAGAIAEFVGRELTSYSDEVIVENGGDIFIKCKKPKKVAIYCNEKSKFTNHLTIEIDPKDTPLGVCTSSGTVGHSLSFGNTDATTIVASSVALADASATAVGNIVKSEEDLVKGIEFAKTISGIRGVIIVINDRM